MTPFKLHGLYGITDTPLMPGEDLLNKVEAALKGGACIIQYRDKTDDHERREQEARALVALCNRYQVPLLVNDDYELAAKIAAPGVHMGQTDGEVAKARALLGEQAIIGVTCHDSLELAIKAEAEGADYVAFGRFFPSNTKPGAKPAPTRLLKEAKEQLKVPICTIGGITLENAPQLIEQGADMIAVVHALFGGEDVTERAKALQQLFG